MNVARTIHVVLERARQLGNIDRTYSIGRFNNITLPADHRLPAYQHQYPLYDRFLPCLAALLPPGSTVVDVGANCGDTLAAMVSANSRLQYICIEPDPGFYKYLVKNIERMTSVDPRVRATTIRTLIGKHIGPVVLQGEGGTKRAKLVDNADAMYEFTLLDDVVNNASGPVSLLKSDVDGCDFDVLRSGSECISRNNPIIYFECDYEDATQLESYHEVVDWLADLGYKEWVIFDNFGGVLLTKGDSAVVHQVFDYVWRQKTRSSTRTIYYVDLLAVPASYKWLAESALNDYAGVNTPITRSIE